MTVRIDESLEGIDWAQAKAPPAPELKDVTVDPQTTALLFLDMMKAGCSARPRCIAAFGLSLTLHVLALVLWTIAVTSPRAREGHDQPQ